MTDYFNSPTIEVMLTQQQLLARVDTLAAEITAAYSDKHPLMIAVLKGAVVFYSDLVRRLNFPMEMEFIAVSSYGKGSTAGELHFRKDVYADLSGRHVLIVEDIIDTGRTLRAVADNFAQRGAASVEFACLLDKPDRRVCDIRPRFTGFTIPNEFVVGYGLDYAEKYRNLPYLGRLTVID